jgi:hypothetical protein
VTSFRELIKTKYIWFTIVSWKIEYKLDVSGNFFDISIEI